MKKLFTLFFTCFATLVMQAQVPSNRIAVMEFKASVGVNQNDVDGISSIFITYFSPDGYTLIERTQIDKAIAEKQFQKSTLTEEQMKEVGKFLNLSKIVIGNVNVIMGEYNVDVRVLEVGTGVVVAKSGISFNSSSYRASMQTLATQLAKQIAIKYTETPVSRDDDFTKMIKDKLSKYRITKEGEAIYCNGIYEYGGGGNAQLFKHNLNNVSRKDFALSFDFLVTDRIFQWPIMLSTDWRVFGFLLNKDGSISITTDNQEHKYPLTTKYVLNTWHKVFICCSNGTLNIQIDNNTAERFTIVIDTENGDNILSSQNYSIGVAFKGYLRNICFMNL